MNTLNDMRRWITLIEARCDEAPKRMYVRFGDIPPAERSQIGAAPNYLKALYHGNAGDQERGVSVFDTEWNAERRRWTIIDVGNFATLDELLAQRRPAYLVSGRRQSSIGIDGETLLRNVIIVKPLKYHDLYVAGWGDDPLPEDYLEENAQPVPVR